MLIGVDGPHDGHRVPWSSTELRYHSGVEALVAYLLALPKFRRLAQEKALVVVTVSVTTFSVTLVPNPNLYDDLNALLEDWIHPWE